MSFECTCIAIQCNQLSKRYIFSSLLNTNKFLVTRMSLGRLFQRAAVDVSHSRLPYFTVLFLRGTRDGTDSDLKDLAGVYQSNILQKYNGAMPCRALYVRISSLNWHRLVIESQFRY